jgi:hypothetical protein
MTSSDGRLVTPPYPAVESRAAAGGPFFVAPKQSYAPKAVSFCIATKPIEDLYRSTKQLY